MKYSEILPGFKCRCLNKFLLKPWFSFTQAVFVSLIYSPDLRNGSSTKTSLDSIEVRGYVIGSPNELNICRGQRLQPRQHSTRLGNWPGSPGIARMCQQPFAVHGDSQLDS